ncbi:uncharacterized protein LY89DRAFT_782733 [Mollisia scopiformis]|uniref:Uncharacterized protein n=1 Tax=Mollisia scopiformis TaxID=149040 RepID=A0A194X8I3_MOLSC|nr:uncharacterized protein LY89DRAFT_782733 [Mollisia scopiformis]KUJ16483.1 hypothetical protein LY89DRAFT_782733 [Mollisia scopiformis]
MDAVDFHGLVSFWTQVGRFFVRRPLVPKGSGDDVLRIDNGWDLRPGGHLSSLPRKHRYYDRMTQEIIVKDPFKMLKYDLKTKEYTSTEEELYVFFFGAFEGGKEVMNWSVTRYKFHLYLRWCTARKDTKFDLTRNGIVKVALDQWVVKAYQEMGK